MACTKTTKFKFSRISQFQTAQILRPKTSLQRMLWQKRSQPQFMTTLSLPWLGHHLRQTLYRRSCPRHQPAVKMPRWFRLHLDQTVTKESAWHCNMKLIWLSSSTELASSYLKELSKKNETIWTQPIFLRKTSISKFKNRKRILRIS